MSKTSSIDAGCVNQALRRISSSSCPGLHPAYPANNFTLRVGEKDSLISTRFSREWPRARFAITFASGMKASVCRNLNAERCTGPPRNNGQSFSRSGRSATTASPTLLPVARFNTNPNAPCASCWQIKTTVRWKKEPRNCPLSSNNWPLKYVSVSGIPAQPRLALQAIWIKIATSQSFVSSSTRREPKVHAPCLNQAPKERSTQGFHLFDDRRRIDPVFRDQLLRLARMRNFVHRQFVHLHPFGAQFPGHRIAQSAFGIMIFHRNHPVPAFAGGRQDRFLRQGLDTVSVDHADVSPLPLQRVRRLERLVQCNPRRHYRYFVGIGLAQYLGAPDRELRFVAVKQRRFRPRRPQIRDSLVQCHLLDQFLRRNGVTGI